VGYVHEIEYLIKQAKVKVRESGNPEGYDAALWMSDWIRTPLPVLNGKTPAGYMHTVEGMKLGSNLLAVAKSGAYA
jgi:hypothetical protein